MGSNLLQLPYGRTYLTVKLPEGISADWIEPVETLPAPDGLAEVENALDHPEDVHLSQWAGARTAAIAINDKTRPVPHHLLLPPLLKRLESMGLEPQNIRLLIATGTHLPMPAEEFRLILPQEIIERYPVISHNCDDASNLIYLGETRQQTPVSVNRLFYEADIRIVTGNLEPHHFMGFSGGAKSAGVGLAGRQTINHNHAMLLDPLSHVGEYDHNPTRQDIEEVGQMMGIHFTLNVVMNADREIVRAFSGSPLSVMRAGIPAARAICQTMVPHRYDLVIASAGGHPKDINLYQAQKALTHASLLTVDGGMAILVAACPEGSGSKGYEQFMEGITRHEDVFDKFQQQGFSVGPHKAIQIARDATRIGIVIVSDMSADLVRRLCLHPAASLDEAITYALTRLPPLPRIAILPKATTTIPVTVSLD
ncbi:MAG TPA: nickel-dependent lactate racemase [Anaerolineaceae bacterium]|nr:nickel-dependent lactate racemase [Anaerolineaceae bacterium]